MIDTILESLIELSRIEAYDAGDPAGMLAAKTEYYTKIIARYEKNNPKDDFYKKLIKTHTKLVEIYSTKKSKNHMLYKNLYFLERLINKEVKRQTEK
jgi:hypothetical protein